MSKEKELVLKIPELLGFSGAEAARYSKTNEMLFDFEIANKESVFARSEEDSFTSRVEHFMRGLKTPENEKVYAKILNLLAIKNYAMKPEQKFASDYDNAVAEVMASDVDVGYTLEDAKEPAPWAN